MPQQPRRVGSSTRILVMLATGAVVAVTGIPAVNAEPLRSLDDVRTAVDELHHKAAEANERYNVAVDEVAATERRLEQAKSSVERQQTKVEQLTTEVGEFAAAAYRAGGADPSLQMLLADDPADFLATASTVDAFAFQQADQLSSVATERQILEQKQLLAADELDRTQAIKTVLAEEKETVEELLSEQQQLLSQLTAEQQVTLNRERQQQGDAALNDRESAVAQLSRAGSGAPASGRAATAVQAALSKIGSAYVYGGKGPSAFDCSGFTSWAWGQAGVSLPSASGAQIGHGQRVSANELQPGDLLFYGSPISHVAMYIGDGMVTHASNPRTGVTTAPAMQAGGSRKPFVGAVRPG